MDSGDCSGNRLAKPSAGLGEIRSHSFSNLFQGFFGVRPAPTSLCDLPSLESPKTCEDSSAGLTVLPPGDDKWNLSYFLLRKHVTEDFGNLRRTATWSELRKFENVQSGNSLAESTAADFLQRNDHELPSHIEISSPVLAGASVGDTRLPDCGIEEFEKDKEYPHHSSAFLSFLTRNTSHDALKPREGEPKLELSEGMDHHVSKSSMQAVPSCSSNTDLVDHSGFPAVSASSEKLPESKHSLKDLLWNFNRERINVSGKEMNLIASIDQ